MIIHYGKKTRKSGRLLTAALRHIEGPSINWGYQWSGDINPAQAVRLAGNKRLALQAMTEAGVPTPDMTTAEAIESGDYLLSRPVVGRPDKHRAGNHFYLITNEEELARALPYCTHFLEFIGGGREFRVHVAFGKSIKLAEKVGGDPIIKNFEKGSTFMYPQDFHHKKTLRRTAIKAVQALGLDFGAVDIIYKDGKYYVLEVNTAPSLTSASDTLQRYIKAFTERER